jgi:hypothetical protein
VGAPVYRSGRAPGGQRHRSVPDRRHRGHSPATLRRAGRIVAVHRRGTARRGWGWNDLTATNELLFSAENTGQLWCVRLTQNQMRGLRPERCRRSVTTRTASVRWVVGCLHTHVLGHFQSPGLSERRAVAARGRLPGEAQTVIAWENLLLAWTKTEWLTRPVDGGVEVGRPGAARELSAVAPGARRGRSRSSSFRTTRRAGRGTLKALPGGIGSSC